MVDADYFLSGLPTKVIEHNLAAYVRIITDADDYLVRNVVRTYADSVTVNVWLDANGLAPIVSQSANTHEFDVRPPTEHKGVTIPFEQIVEVIVVPAPQSFGRFAFL
jgi:hypothetical protein